MIWSRMIFGLLLPFVLLGCLEEEEGVGIKNLLDELDGQRFDIGRTKEFVAAEKMKLKNYQQAAEDQKKGAELEEALVKVEEAIEENSARNTELSDTVELIQLEFEKLRNLYRVSARKAAIDKTVDLSATKGEGFENVRIMGVNPVAIKVYMSSGPQLIPFRDIPAKVREMLLMSEEEAAEYLQRRGEDAAARAVKLKEWKAGQAERNKEAAKSAFLDKVRDLQDEIFKREDAINIRIGEIKGWKSKASNLELESGNERNEKKAARLMRHAELVRDKAQALSLINSDAWIVVGRLKAELEDLKRTGGR